MQCITNIDYQQMSSNIEPNYGALAQSGVQGIQLGADMYNDFNRLDKFNAQKAIDAQNYSEEVMPYYNPTPVPAHLKENNTLEYAGKFGSLGANIGTAITPGLGTAIGLASGALVGATAGMIQKGQANKKLDRFMTAREAEEERYRNAMTNYYDNMRARKLRHAQMNQMQQRSINSNNFDFLDGY